VSLLRGDLAKVPALEALSAHSQRRPQIARSLDWQRIQALPVRWISREQGEALSAELTPDLTTAVGKANGLKLKWIQALALWEIYQGRGAYLGIPVGGGKTLLSYLCAYILGARRPYLIIPESLREKTFNEFGKYNRAGWVAPLPPPTLLGMKFMQQEHNLRYLHDVAKPDMVFIDECDLLRNFEAACPKRIDRYKADSIPMAEADGEWFIDVETWQAQRANALAETVGPIQEWARARGVPFICATGTGTRFSIRDFTHLLNWGREHGSPVPLDPDEQVRWANALDEQRAGSTKRRLRAGALLELLPGFEIPAEFRQTELAHARACFQFRLRGTPCVIITDESDCDQPLTINLVAAPEDPLINAAFDDFRLEWQLPDGQEIIDSLSFWRGEIEMGCGFFGKWKYPPPEDWRNARRAYFHTVKDEIKRTAWSLDPRDTAKAVAKALPDHPCVRAWLDIKDSFKPEPETEWISASVVDYAARWAKAHPRHGLIWVQSIPLGEAIAAACKLKYYGDGGEAYDGSSIEYAPDTCAVVSIGANTRGRNLQDRFCDGLVCGMPQSAEKLEQLIGRYHRSEQYKPVTWDFLMTSGGTRYAFDVATREAEFVLSSQAQKQKLLRARINDWTPPSDALRWVRKPAD